jgi:hypothetical protein
MGATTTIPDTDELYDRYGKPLEQNHHGEYGAISSDGRVIVDRDDLVVMDRAIDEFGSGNFSFYRIGYSYVDNLRWGYVGQPRLSVSPDKNHRA